ncbi:MAG: SPOR domain-containing protein, partial [Gammaproteobacteria bacterium]|nr:SPOR domain-containing protein [Gammaproteobacteria bacterium]
EGGGGGKMAIIAMVLATLSLALGGWAVWSLMAQGDDLFATRDRLELMELRLAEIDAGGNQNAKMEQLNERLNRFESQGLELAQTNEKNLASLEQQLKKLQQKLSEMAQAETQTAKSPGKTTPEAKNGAKKEPTQAVAANSVEEWAINLFSLSTKSAASAAVNRLRRAGVRDVVIQQTMNSGRAWYRVRIIGFNSKEEAQRYIMTIPKSAGIESAWVTRD